MKKMLMLIVSVAMAVALTGCGCSKQSAEEQEKKAKEGLDSSKGVAESFVNAIAKKDFDKVLACLDTTDTAVFTPKVVKNVKEEFEKLGKEINDDKLEAKAVREEIDVPSESHGYKILNGKKYTGERAMVSVQFVKGKDKLSRGRLQRRPPRSQWRHLRLRHWLSQLRRWLSKLRRWLLIPRHRGWLPRLADMRDSATRLHLS